VDDIEDGSLRLRVSMRGIDMDGIGGFAFGVMVVNLREALSCDVGARGSENIGRH